MAMEAQGCAVFFSTTSSMTTAAGGRVGQVVSFTGPSGAAGVIDVTHLASTAKEKLMGLRDEGNIGFSCNFLATDAVQIKVREQRATRTLSNIAIGFTDTASPHLIHSKCYITNFSLGGSVDNKMTLDFTAELTGPITWTTFTP